MLKHHAFQLIRQSILISTIATTGCAAAMNDDNTDRFNPQQSLAAAKGTLGEAIIAGMEISDAVSYLQANRFSCQDAKPGTAGPAKRSVLCTFSPPPPEAPAKRMTAPLAPIDWFVTLDSANGTTVSRMDIQRYPKDLGD